jgi:hypothetical protein
VIAEASKEGGNRISPIEGLYVRGYEFDVYDMHGSLFHTIPQ